jgi:hypothetical protein
VLDIAYDPPRNAESSEDGETKSKAIKWIIIDSIIIASIALLSSLPPDRLPSLLDLYVALKAFLYSFFIQLAVERGLKPFFKSKTNSKEGEQ